MMQSIDSRDAKDWTTNLNVKYSKDTKELTVNFRQAPDYFHFIRYKIELYKHPNSKFNPDEGKMSSELTRDHLKVYQQKTFYSRDFVKKKNNNNKK